MEKESIRDKIETLSKNGKISCRVALKLAEENAMSPAEMGQLLNDMKIKVASCQLGCFP
jgi:hypothetical protein